MCNDKKKQLINWSVVLAGGTHKLIEFNNSKLMQFSQRCVFRSTDYDKFRGYKNIWATKVLSEPMDELCDLNSDEWEITKEKHQDIINHQRNRGKRTSKLIYSGKAARYTRGEGSKKYRGLLIIYPVITGVDKDRIIEESATFGFAVSFPKTAFEGDWSRVPRDWFRDTGIDV